MLGTFLMQYLNKTSKNRKLAISGGCSIKELDQKWMEKKCCLEKVLRHSLSRFLNITYLYPIVTFTSKFCYFPFYYFLKFFKILHKKTGMPVKLADYVRFEVSLDSHSKKQTFPECFPDFSSSISKNSRREWSMHNDISGTLLLEIPIIH